MIKAATKFGFLFALFTTPFIIGQTGSHFGETEQLVQNSVTTAVSFTAATPTPTPSGDHIVINEVSSDGNESEEWVELFNPTSSPVDVTGWSIEDNFNQDVFPTVSSIPAGGYGVVIASDSAVIGIPPSAVTIILSDTLIGNGLNNDGDTLTLKNSSSSTIDSMSYGDDTSVFPAPPAAPGAGETVARSPNGTDTDSAADWVIDTSPSIGIAN